MALVWLACEKESSTPVAPSPPPGDFALRCAPAGFAAGRGCGNSTCTITSQHGFTGPVTLACSGQPPGLNCGFGPGNPLAMPANGSVVGTAAGGLRHPTPVQLQIVRPELPPRSGRFMTVVGCAGYAGGTLGPETVQQFRSVFVGAWRGSFRGGALCSQTLGERDGSFVLDVSDRCFAEGEPVYLTAGGLPTCTTSPFAAGSLVPVTLIGRSSC